MFVGNLSYGTTRDELAAALAPAGAIVSIVMPTDRETGRPRGFAFVEFATDAEAAEAVRRFGELELGGRKLRINAAEDRPPRRADGPRPPRTAGPPPDAMGFGGGAGGAGAGGRGFEGRRFKSKGSRRGLRRRKRSL